MFSPGEIWSMIGGGAVVIFGAGQIVEKVRNGKYVTKTECSLTHKVDDGRISRIEADVSHIRAWVDKQTGGLA